MDWDKAVFRFQERLPIKLVRRPIKEVLPRVGHLTSKATLFPFISLASYLLFTCLNQTSFYFNLIFARTESFSATEGAPWTYSMNLLSPIVPLCYYLWLFIALKNFYTLPIWFMKDSSYFQNLKISYESFLFMVWNEQTSCYFLLILSQYIKQGMDFDSLWYFTSLAYLDWTFCFKRIRNVKQPLPFSQMFLNNFRQITIISFIDTFKHPFSYVHGSSQTQQICHTILPKICQIHVVHGPHSWF